MDATQCLVVFVVIAGIAVLYRREMIRTRAGSAEAAGERIADLEDQLDDLQAQLRELERWAVEQHGYQLPRPMGSAGEQASRPVRELRSADGASPVLTPGLGSEAVPAAASLALPLAAPGDSGPLPTTAAPPSAEPLLEPPPTPPWPSVEPPPGAGPEEMPPKAATPGRTRQPATPPLPVWSFGDLEQLLSGRGLAWIGGLAILIGAAFFLGLAFTRGWIGPGARVSIGLLAGTLLYGGGAWFFERREALFGHVLLAVGLGTISISLLAATRLYGLIASPVGLLAALLIATTAAIIAIRASSQVVAGYGLVAALAAPPLLGAAPTASTLAFLATTLIGTTLIALYRAWSWLPTVAFLLSAPQLWSWLTGGASLPAGMLVLSGFWCLHALAAGGDEFRTRRQYLPAASATLLVANAAFLVAAGFAVLQAAHATAWRAFFLVVIACAHAVLGGYFLAREGDRHPFGLLALGTGLAALTMAVPIQLGAPAVPIAWAAEAVALAWVYTWRHHGYSGIAAIVLGCLAIAHLLIVEYPLDPLLFARPHLPPFANAAGGALGFTVLALVVAAYLVPSWHVRIRLVTTGVLLIVYALPREVSGVWLLAGWAVLCVLVLGVDHITSRQFRRTSTTPELFGLPAAAGIAGSLALAHMFVVDLPLADVGGLPRTPFADARTAAVGVLVLACLLAARIVDHAGFRRALAVLAVLLAGYLMLFELPAAAMVVAWGLLALGLCLRGWRDVEGAVVYLPAAGALAGFGLLVVFARVAPLDRLAVQQGVTIDHPLFWSGATAALGTLIAGLCIVYRLFRFHRQARWLAILAGALGVYLLSVGIVDEFQRQTGHGVALATLQKQAQVALSILWAVLGGAIFVAGVARWRAMLRWFGLGLLALATAKVFLYDLASLDATYKVLSFIGLGVLLLASSYAYQRLKPQRVVVEAQR